MSELTSEPINTAQRANATPGASETGAGKAEVGQAEVGKAGGMSQTYALWRRLSGKPLGRQVFAAGLSLRVPYFRTILPTITEMRPGYCEVRAPLWWGVWNHIKTFHAIACCNMAEIAMGMLAEATVPSTHRWLPKSMTVEYTAKAETSLRAVAELPVIPEFDGPMELPIPVNVYDTGDQVVVRGTITIWVTPKPAKS